MRRLLLPLLLCAALPVMAAETVETAPFTLVIHGGAGAPGRGNLDVETEAAVRAALNQALDAGANILSAGGSSLDAVSAAVQVLENSPHFNAGKGAVFTADGINELDASIMYGPTRAAGAVAGLHRVKNPITLARAVMEHSEHVMMIGDGAEKFAESQGIELVDPSYFRTDYRWQQLQKVKADEAAQAFIPPSTYFGTVGAVARDQQGHLAAATSTGGMTNKRWGRVGDAPIIGAGTYADSRCAVSATGWGEFFIRLNVAHDICARVAYAQQPLRAAADAVIMKDVPEMGGDGGIIAVDANGELTMPFNTVGMYRAWIKPDGTRGVAIFADEADPDQRVNAAAVEPAKAH